MSPAPRQHTPGPWHSEGYPRYVGPTVVSPDGPVCAISTGPLDRTLPRMPAAANARLIAAAPDLLNLLTAADRLETLTGENLAVYARTYAALARAAIAKATGGNTPAA